MKKQRDITRTELSLLRLLWKEGSSTIRQLTDQLYPDGAHSEYATVQSLLDRLERKGYVTRTKRGRLNVYAAKISRGELVAQRLRETADSLCGGSLAPLLSHLVRDANPTPEELDALQQLVHRLAAGDETGVDRDTPSKGD